MNRTFVAVAALSVLSILGARPTPAQEQPFRLRFTPPPFALSLRPFQLDSGLLRALRLAPFAGAIECPMPVSVPDSSSLERMPTARVDTTGMAIRIARPGCFNPLGPKARSTELRPAPRHP
jgi:hypothetical protein